MTFQKTKTWKQSNDPLKEAKLDRIEEIFERFSDRVFAFDEFGPLAIHPIGDEGAAAVAGEPSQALWGAAVPCLLFGGRGPPVGVVRAKKGIDNSLGGDQVVSGGAP